MYLLHGYVLSLSEGLLTHTPEDEPTFCHSPAEFGAISMVGTIMDNRPWTKVTEGQTDVEVEIVL